MYPNQLIFNAVFNKGQIYTGKKPDGDIYQKQAEIHIGYILGQQREIRAGMTQNVLEQDDWHLFNVVDDDNIYYESVAILGVASVQEAQYYAQRYFAETLGAMMQCVYVGAYNYKTLKRFLDSINSIKNIRIKPDVMERFIDVTVSNEPVWEDEVLLSHSGSVRTLLAELVANDDNRQLLDAMDIGAFAEYVQTHQDTEQLDALFTDVVGLTRLARQLTTAMDKKGSDVVRLSGITQSPKPFKRNGMTNLALMMNMSDGQSVSVLFYNPDETPSKLQPKDILASWKWTLNNRDVTAALQPETGKDVSIDTLAGRIMQLVEKNHSRFVRNKAKQEQENAKLAELQSSLEQRQSTLAELDSQIADMQAKVDELIKNPVTPIEQQTTARQSREQKTAQDDLDTQPVHANQDEINNQSTANKKIIKGRKNRVKTAKGTKIDTVFALADSKYVIASHTETGGENPKYDQSLQPRDRGRENSIMWVIKTANNLDPESLGRTGRADTGAPIIGDDMMVESGNGRTMAIKLAYKNGKADDYVQWLKDEADMFGFTAEQVERFKEPILVRIRTTQIDRATFAIEANQDDKLSLSATERAKADAKRLSDGIMDNFNPSDDGDILAASNRQFVQSFLSMLGDAEASQYTDSNGNPTQALVSRIKACVFAKAYNDDRLLEMMADVANPELQNMLNALSKSAPKFIKARVTTKGDTQDLSEKLVDGIELALDQKLKNAIVDATNLILAAKHNNQVLAEYVKQQSLFGDTDPVVIELALFVAKNARSTKKMTEYFNAMAEYITQDNLSRQNFNMFGEPKPLTLSDVMAYANKELGLDEQNDAQEPVEPMQENEPTNEPQAQEPKYEYRPHGKDLTFVGQEFDHTPTGDNYTVWGVAKGEERWGVAIAVDTVNMGKKITTKELAQKVADVMAEKFGYTNLEIRSDRELLGSGVSAISNAFGAGVLSQMKQENKTDEPTQYKIEGDKIYLTNNGEIVKRLMTKKDWQGIPKDYRVVRADGTHTVLHFGSTGTTSIPVEIISQSEFEKILTGKDKTMNELTTQNPNYTQDDIDYLQSIINGTLDLETVDFDRLIAIGEKDDTDPLFEQANDVISEALDKATQGE